MHRFSIVKEFVRTAAVGDILFRTFANHSEFPGLTIVQDRDIEFPLLTNNSVLLLPRITTGDDFNINFPVLVNSSTVFPPTIQSAPSDISLIFPGLVNSSTVVALTVQVAPADGFVYLPLLVNSSTLNPPTIETANPMAVLAETEANDTVSATGIVKLQGVSTITEANDTILAVGVGADMNYGISFSAPQVTPYTASQVIGHHRFAVAVTIPADFGAYLTRTSRAGGSAVTTASTVFSVEKAAAATPNTFSQIGTITFAIGTVTPTFATSGGIAINFAANDVLRIVAPASPDGSFAGFYATIVGFET